MEERREDLDAGEGSREVVPGKEASKGESDRWRWLGSVGPRLGEVSAGDMGRDMGAKEGSDFARMRPRRPG